MRVRMRGQISGTRNGVPWPHPGEVTDDLPDDEALVLLRTGMAEAVEDEPVVETAAVEDASEKPARKAAPRRKGGLTKKNSGLTPSEKE